MAHPLGADLACATVSQAVPTLSGQAVASKVGAYVALTKPRIIELLLVTTVPAMVVAQRGLPDVWLIVVTVIGGTMAAGGANAINMFVDRDIDAVMERTRNRPLVTGAVTPQAALAFAVGLEVVAFLWLWGFVNLLSATLAVGATAFYVFVYTLWLKRSSSQNIVIGGAAGAAPVLIGWSAVTNHLAWAPWVMFAIVFFWTPPHFWALAIKYRDDYTRARVPMLPSVTGERAVGTQIVAYSIVVLGVSLLLVPVADMGWIYTVTAAVTGAMFVGWSVRLLRRPSARNAMKLFGYSITYLTVLFVSMAVDQLVVHGL
jgi:protoheme IX farnesyltransferase